MHINRRELSTNAVSFMCDVEYTQQTAYVFRPLTDCRAMGAVMSLSISPLSPLLQFLALSSVALILTALVPFTKVEESFSMQAVHDFLFLSEPKNLMRFMTRVADPNTYQQSTESQLLQRVFNTSDTSGRPWDHQHFPGVVHRTFLGPFFVSLLTQPFARLFAPDDKFYVQLLSRSLLALSVMTAFSRFGRAVQFRYGPTTRRALSVLTLTQFHFLFYASRALPNTFALVAVMLTCAYWLERRWTSFTAWMAFTVLVLRVETVILFAWITVYELLVTRQLRLWTLIRVGVPAGLISLLFTFLFDSYLWSRPVWPEGDALLFNVVANRSHEYGTHPFLWYFYSAVPRAMLISAVFVPFCCREMLTSLVSVSALFLLTYSFLPHKELRFVVYVIPLLNACAANTIAVVIERFEESVPKKNESYLVNVIWRWLWPRDAQEAQNGSVAAKDANKYDAIPSSRALRRRGHRGHGLEAELSEQYEKITQQQLQSASDKCAAPSGWCMTLAFIVMAIHVWCNVAATVFMSLAAWHNYPGGEAVAWLNHHIQAVDNYHDRSTVGVYVCNLAAQTGFTRFLELDGVFYDKQPRLQDETFARFGITYLVLEKNDVHSLQSRCSGSGADVTCHIGKHIRNCRIMKSVTGFNGLDFSLAKQVVIKTAPMLWIFRCQK